MSETEFFKHLRDEKLATEESRSKYTLRKLAYATALLGVGSLTIERLELSFLLYLVPLVAFAFDWDMMEIRRLARAKKSPSGACSGFRNAAG